MASGTFCYYFYLTHFMWNMLSFCVTFRSHEIKDIDFKLLVLVHNLCSVVEWTGNAFSPFKQAT